MTEHGYNVLPLTTILSEMNTQLYRHFDEGRKLLYVGISLSTFARLSQHKDHSEWFEKIKTVEIQHFQTRDEAMAAERQAIKTENPKFNIAMKKTLAEIAKEQKEAIEQTSRELREKGHIINRVVNHHIVYTIDEVRYFLNMTRSELETHIEAGTLSVFEVEGKKGPHPMKMKTMVSGWSLIDFIGYLERKNK
jgi:predicted GIY-YIG superfamily endonuclease